jgi:hypothetical protein
MFGCNLMLFLTPTQSVFVLRLEPQASPPQKQLTKIFVFLFPGQHLFLHNFSGDRFMFFLMFSSKASSSTPKMYFHHCGRRAFVDIFGKPTKILQMLGRHHP